MSAEERLRQLGLSLPQVPTPVANYPSYRIVGNLLFLAVQGPRDADKVGAEVSVDEGYKRARLVGLQLLSTTRAALGSLDRGFSCTPGRLRNRRPAAARVMLHVS